MEQSESTPPEPESEEEIKNRILPLLRLLLRDPPKDHDCKTCPICKEYGITEY